MFEPSFAFQFDKEISPLHRMLMDEDKTPPEKLPQNVSELLHFPNRDMIADDPEKVFEALLTLGAKHHIPIKYMEVTWSLMRHVFWVFTGERPLGFARLREIVLGSLPGCKLYYVVRNKRTGQTRYVEGSSFKKKTFPANKYEAVVCETRASLRQLMKYHAELHQGDIGRQLRNAVTTKELIMFDVYIDGVKATSTGSWKMLSTVIRHECCNLMLNYSTFVYAKDHQLTADDILEGLLKDLHRNRNMHVRLVVCDMPERLRLCCLINFNGEHGCLVCVSPGEKREGGPGVIWPFWTTTAELRDDESFQRLADAARDVGLAVAGQKSRSPFLDFPNFSITESVCIDTMHLFAGFTRYLWEKVGDTYLTKRDFKELTDKINRKYTELRMPSDCKRAPRDIDVANYRANEWKQLLALCGLDIGLEYARQGFPEVCKMWHRYTFVLRMLAQGDEWYKHGSYSGHVVTATIQLLYKDVEGLLGKNACVPNLHALFHLPLWRARYTMAEMSAEKAESFYGKNKKSFAEQGMSVGKQIHYNTLLAHREGHACKTRFRFKTKTSESHMDHVMVDKYRRSWYYTGTDDEDDYYTVRQIGIVSHYTEVSEMHWGDCGIFRVVGMDAEAVHVRKSDVIARGIITHEHLLHVWTEDLQDF